MNNTICCTAVAYHLSDDLPSCLLYSFIYIFLRFPNKNPTFLVLLTKSWTRGMDGGIPLEAVPNQLCSKHNSNDETFVLPENGKSRICSYSPAVHLPNPDVFQCKICVSVVINWRGLGRVMRGIAGRGVTRHMSALTTNRNQLILIITFTNCF